MCSNPRFKQVHSHVWSFWLSGPESTSNILSNASISLRMKLERIIPTIPKSLALWGKSYANNTWYLKAPERTAEEIWGLNQLRRGKWRCETSQTHGELVIIDLSLGSNHSNPQKDTNVIYHHTSRVWLFYFTGVNSIRSSVFLAVRFGKTWTGTSWRTGSCGLQSRLVIRIKRYDYWLWYEFGYKYEFK